MSSNKQIAKNTIFLYIRMLVVMAVTFFTSRIVLEALGVDGYGTYSLIGGIAFSFGFFSSALSNATQRYLSFAHGTGEKEAVSHIFNATAIIYILLGGGVLLIGSFLGPILIKNVKIPLNMVNPAYWVYYCTLISLTFTLTATMFDSVLIARENMKVYAYLSIFDVIGKLAIAYLILITNSHKLIFYVVALMILTIIVKGVTVFFCIKNYSECNIRLHWDRVRIKELSKFIGWNGLGTLAFAINDQGINLLLNFFFGPVVNAARGIANQVNTAITHFSQNFLLAISPQMMKSYSCGDRNKFINLYYISGKISFLMLWILFLPIIIRRNEILHFWLKEVPEYTSTFLLWIIIYSLVNIYNYPQWMAAQAVGKIRNYVIITNIIFLANIPISWLFLKSFTYPVLIFQILVIVRVGVIVSSWFIVRKMIRFSIWKYIKECILPNILLVFITYPIAIMENKIFPKDFIGLVCNSIMVIISTGIIAFYLVIPRNYRRVIVVKIREKIHK